MLGFIKGWMARRQEAKKARTGEVLDAFKVRYHTFRALLANNERALELISDFEVRLAAVSPGEGSLPSLAEELEDVCFELVDGLNLLTGDGYTALYDRHSLLCDGIGQSLDAMDPEAVSAPAVVFLDDLTPAMHPLAGGKAGSLAALRRAGLPVPDGFVITLPACREFLRVSGVEAMVRHVMLKAVHGGEAASASALDEISASAARLLQAARPPERLAAAIAQAHAAMGERGVASFSVRSSAASEDQLEHSFAGQYVTLLNVSSLEALLAAFKEVLAGAFSARALSYKLQAGLAMTELDMAVLCQAMVPARAAGVLFTLDPVRPDSGRMLTSAVPGLGTLAVGGEAPADVYRIARGDHADVEAVIAVKTLREVAADGHNQPSIQGLVREAVPEAESRLPLLGPAELEALARHGLVAEALAGNPQDVEWAVTAEGRIMLLQSRPLRVAVAGRMEPAARGQGECLVRGSTASPGRCLGRARHIRSAQDLETLPVGPVIAVMRQSLVEAARFLHRFQGVVVELGNPTDHLSCVARERGRPMLTGAAGVTGAVEEGRWLVLDADKGCLSDAPAGVRDDVLALLHPPGAQAPPIAAAPLSPTMERLRDATVALHLTDAYGPSFSILECRSLHDIVRFVHEMAVLTMFQAGDTLLEEAYGAMHRLEETLPLEFFIVDVGGGLAPGAERMVVGLEEVLSVPFQALWRGMATPGLRWGPVAGAVNLGGVLMRGMLDKRGNRPLGNVNFALVASDYLNLNARVDFHFAMIDAVCSFNPAENSIRFRFKGGGTLPVQRERRADFLARVLRSWDFFTDQRGDLVTASYLEAEQRAIEERLAMLGRLLGFSRQLDAAMVDDDAPERLARAFLAGDFALGGLASEGA